MIRILIALATATFVVASPVHAALIGNSQGGAEFPLGAISFADDVVSYMPGMVGSQPTEPNRGAANALGLPDYAGAINCTTQVDCPYVSLGDGGSIVLQFVDNVLTGSDSSDLDLWVFEVGSDIEDTFVDVSFDGVTWSAVGKVFGSTAGIDLDAFGLGASDIFRYVRLTDDTNADDQSGATVGADIDAVGAISTSAVPLPAGSLLLGTGLGAVLIRLRRRRPSH